MYFRLIYAAAFALVLLSSSASAQLVNFSQDFEGLDRTDPNALANDGWLLFAGSTNGNAAFPDFGAGPFGAPNNIADPQVSVISDVPSGGAPPAGSQGLTIFSDYSSALHSDPNDPRNLVISVFQEQTITAADIGGSVVFDFLADANSAPPTGNAFAEAFILTLDPQNGFAATNNLVFDTTSLVDGSPTAGQITLDLSDAALAGQILQFGFRNSAQDFEGSAVDYDNVSFSVVPEPSSIALLGMIGLGMFTRRRR